MNTRIALTCLFACFALASCTAPPKAPTQETAAAQSSGGPDLKAEYAGLAKKGGRVLTVDPAASSVRIYVFRGGTAAKVGHNHVLSAPTFLGFIHMPSAELAAARFDLEFRLDQLEIDNPAYRSLLGSAFASVLPPGAIEGTRAHMLGEDNLEADKYPFVRIHSLQMNGEAPKLAAKVQVEMHGQRRDMWVPLTVAGLPEKLSVSGTFVLRQTDFGAEPYSVLGGLLAVKDEVVIEFTLVGR